MWWGFFIRRNNGNKTYEKYNTILNKKISAKDKTFLIQNAFLIL